MQTGIKPAEVERPQADEYNPYYEKYVSLVTESDLLAALDDQGAELRTLFGQISEERGTFSYAEGKWTIKEVLSHLIDGERIFSYRVLRVARGDETPIEGFEQDGYIENSHANLRTFDDMLGEFSELRSANLRLLRNLRKADWLRIGTASGSAVSVRAVTFIMAGHIRHHVRILKERYLA